MKAIRIAVLGALLLVSGAVTAHAQDARRGGNRALNGIELTEAQKVKFEDIQKKYQPELQALRESAPNGDRAETMKKLEAIRLKQYAEFRAVLTPAQQAVFDKHLEELKAQRAQMQGQAPPAN